MPDVIIKGMEMPENCKECRLHADGWCYAVEDQPFATLGICRPDWCPLRPAPEWISASTPPDTNRFVLVMNDDGRCGVAQYVGDDIAPITQWQIAYCLYDVDIWDDEEQGLVCWWRELPEPPKEET